MRGITIEDKVQIEGHRYLSFDLRDLLELFEEQAELSTWRASHVECIGEAAEEMHRLEDEGVPIGGHVLLALAKRISQTIDGKFCGFLDNCAVPWVTICAVDSSCFDVWTDDSNIHKAIRRRFRDVRDIVP